MRKMKIARCAAEKRAAPQLNARANDKKSSFRAGRERERDRGRKPKGREPCDSRSSRRAGVDATGAIYSLR